MRRVLAGCLAVVAAIGVSAVPGASASVAETCQRTVGVEPQSSAGEGTGRLTFAVYSDGCAAAGGVVYTVTAGTARPGADFQLANGYLRWAAGDANARLITALIVPDLDREDDFEDFTVRLTALGTDVRIANPTGHGRILDDDDYDLKLRPRIWVVDDTICGPLTPNLRCGCSKQVIQEAPNCPIIELSMSTPSATPMVAHWSTVDGTARAGVDFVGVVDQARTVPAGATTAELPVRLLPQPEERPARWFYIRISAVSEGTIADAVAVVTLPPT